MLRPENIKPLVLYVGEDHCAAILGPILAMVVRTDPLPGTLDHQKQWLTKLKAQTPGGSAFVTVLRSDAPPPPDKERLLIKQVFQQFGEVVSAGAMVIEGKGFVAATLRSILSMILLALRPNYPFKIFANLEDGLKWALGHLDNPGVTPDEVLQEFERLKASFQARTLVVNG